MYKIFEIDSASLTEADIKLILNTTKTLVKENLFLNIQKEVKSYNNKSENFHLISREEGFMPKDTYKQEYFSSLNRMRYITGKASFPPINSASNYLGAFPVTKPQHATFVSYNNENHNLYQKLFELIESSSDSRLIKARNWLKLITTVERTYKHGEDSDKIKALYYINNKNERIFISSDQLDRVPKGYEIHSGLYNLYTHQPISKTWDKNDKEALVKYGLTPEFVIFPNSHTNIFDELRSENALNQAKSYAKNLNKERKAVIEDLNDQGFFEDLLNTEEVEKLKNAPILITNINPKNPHNNINVVESYCGEKDLNQSQPNFLEKLPKIYHNTQNVFDEYGGRNFVQQSIMNLLEKSPENDEYPNRIFEKVYKVPQQFKLPQINNNHGKTDSVNDKIFQGKGRKYF